MSQNERAGAPVTALVLAAGLSRRMGARNKLLEPVDGVPMVRRVVEQALASQCDEVVVVLGHEAQRLRQALEGLTVRWAVNTQYEEGLGASVRTGAAAVPPGHAALVCLGDMPRVGSATMDALVRACRADAGKAAYQPVWRGQRGNPVLWSPGHVQALQGLKGDEGARALLRALGDEVALVPVADDGILLDVDTPQALAALAAAGADGASA